MRRYSKRTVDSYLYWVRYYIRYHDKCHPAEMGAREVLSFLTFLSAQRKVAASTQKVALNALAYLYSKYLGMPLGSLGEFNKARQPRKLPVVLTREVVQRLLGNLRGSLDLLASLLHGSGLRRIEAIRRVGQALLARRCERK
jgi:integrase